MKIDKRLKNMIV